MFNTGNSNQMPSFLPSFLPSELTCSARVVRTVVAVAALTVMALPQARAAGVSGQGTWETTLQGRDLDGNFANGFEAYYDTDLDITWLANAGAFHGGWSDAKAWADSLNVNGTVGWRLPDLKPVNSISFNYSYSFAGDTDYGFNITSQQSELAHLYYVTLGNKGYLNTSGGSVQPYYGLQNTGLFGNVQAGFYWSGAEYSPITLYAWGLSTGSGKQLYSRKGDAFFAWAVHSGDVGVAASVPEPETYGLAVAGLFVVGVLARRRAA